MKLVSSVGQFGGDFGFGFRAKASIPTYIRLSNGFLSLSSLAVLFWICFLYVSFQRFPADRSRAVSDTKCTEWPI